MDIQAAQLRQRIEQTRTAMTAMVDLSKQYLSQKVAATVERSIIASLHGLLETTTKSTTLLQQYPWLIIVGGALFGYQLDGAHSSYSTDQAGAESVSTGYGAPPTAPPAVARATPQDHESPPQPFTQAVAPPTLVEPPRATPLESRPSARNFGGIGAKALARRVIHEIQKDDCLGRAAQLGYYFLFALFPFFLLLTTLLGYLPIPNLLDRMMEVLAPLLPGDALRLVQENLSQLVTGARGGLLSFGILAVLWTSSSALTPLIDSLNRAYDVEEGRPFWKVRLIVMLLTVGLSVFMVVALVLLTFGPQLGRWVADLVGLGEVFAWVWNILRWPVIGGLLILAIAMVYYVGPDVEQEWKWITPGSIFAISGWLLTSLGFAFYVNHFGSYNATYGTIGAVIVLLTWMYLSGLFMLIGGEINAEIEHASQARKDPGEKELPRS